MTRTSWLTVAAVMASVLMVDQFAKALAPHVNSSMVLPAQNHGVLTGAGVMPTPILVAATVGVFALFVGVIGRWAVQVGISAVLPALVAGGIFAHILDRAVYGSVRDFLRTGWLIIDVADLAIVVGIVGMAVAFAFRMADLRRHSRTIVFELPTFRALVVDI